MKESLGNTRTGSTQFRIVPKSPSSSSPPPSPSSPHIDNSESSETMGRNFIDEGSLETYICANDIPPSKEHSILSMKQGEVFALIEEKEEWLFGTNLNSKESGWVHISNLLEDVI